MSVLVVEDGPVGRDSLVFRRLAWPQQRERHVVSPAPGAWG